MHRAARLLGAPLALTLILGACSGGGGDDEADVTADMEEQLVDQGFTQDEAECIAEVIVDELGTDEINDVDFSLEEPPAELQDEISAASLKALEDCG